MDIEQRVRSELQHRAQEADVTVPVMAVAAELGHRARRRRSALRVMGAAATVVLVVGVGIGVAASREQPRPDRSPSSGPTFVEPASGWRTEYWRTVAVDVPADWGWGSSAGVCSAPPEGRPYVGRPIGTTGDCAPSEPDATPTAPYVWLGAAVDVGTTDLGDGYMREVVEVDGVTVAVASRDAAFRARVLDSVTRQSVCDARLDRIPTARTENSTEGVGPLVSATLCAYRADRSEGFHLVYGKEIEGAVYSASAQASREAPEKKCTGRPFETVVLTAVFEDPYSSSSALHLTQQLVYRFTCGTVSLGGYFGEEETSYAVTEATVPWATSEFRELLTGPGDAWAAGRFIGMVF